MDWYEDYKKDLEEMHFGITKMWKLNYRENVSLLVLISIVVLGCSITSVVYFCRGNWNVIAGVCYVLIAIFDSWLGVRTMRRMKECKEHIKANDMWYESELNRLNNLIKESENGNENS